MLNQSGVLAFVDRVARDSEFREWFVVSPIDALASCGLTGQHLRELERVLEWEDQHRHLAQAMRPFVHVLIETIAVDPHDGVAQRAAYERLSAEVLDIRGRLAAARAEAQRARPWWKFW